MQRFFRGALFLWPLVALAVGGLIVCTRAVTARPGPALARQPAPLQGTPTVTPGCLAGWSLVTSPNVGTHDNYLYGATVIAPNDVWAVGYYYNGFASQTLIEHWNGMQWSIVSSPNVGAGTSVLLAVAAVAANDVWTVGHAGTQTLIEHWNGTSWSIVPSPSMGTGMQGFDGLGVVATNDIWAVGHYFATGSGAYRTLVAHWNGGGWSLVPSPNVGTADNFLWGGVAVVAANDLWAVGSSGANGSRRTLTLHWNGTVWAVVPSPNVGPAENRLNGVVALAANDAWAVGYAGVSPNEQTLTLHWDGSAWSVVPSPNTGPGSNVFQGVTTLAANQVWAVGFAGSATLTARWDGVQWQIVPSPNQTGASYLVAVAPAVPGELWAVGFADVNNVGRTLTLHYAAVGNGCPSPTRTATPTRTPTRTPTPVCPPGVRGVIIIDSGFVPSSLTIPLGTTVFWTNDGPSAHTTTSDSGIWDSGMLNPGQTFQFTFNTPGNYPYHCALHPTLTGTITVTTCIATPSPSSTSVVPGPSPSRTPNVPSPTNIPLPTNTTTGTPRTSATPMNTPGGNPSATPPVVTPTPTVCPFTFNDVLPGSPFYAYVRCLVCRGIVNGYPCGGPGEPCPGLYYRPNNNVTRGQVSKIIGASAGFVEPVPSAAQTFEDVAPGGTFWLWVERLANRGIIGGYPCGSPVEPCIAPTNRPYLRPNNDVTRGQLSKIVAGAAGWTETPIGQTFEDVPPGSTFYLWIERLASRSIIAGYPCGGVGEPCIIPTNRPYFRTNNNATRGQMSKIAAQTFFPNCQTARR